MKRLSIMRLNILKFKDDLKQYLIDLGHKLEGKPAKKTNIKSIEHDIRWIFHMT